MQTSSLFGTPTTTQQPRTGSTFGGSTTSAIGTTTNQPALGPFGAIWPGTSASTPGSANAFGQPKHVTEFRSTFGQSSWCLVTIALLSI